MSNDELEQILDAARQLVKQRDWMGALDTLDQVTHLNLKCTSAWYEKGKILNRLGRFEEALEAFETVVGINPEDCDGWYNKGVILTKLGRTEESLEAYYEAKRLNPESSDQTKLEGIDFLGILGRDQTALEGLQQSTSKEDSGVYINERFMYRVDLDFVWNDGEEETLTIEEISPSTVDVKSARYPQCSLTIESNERVCCNYPAKELAADLVTELAIDEHENRFYVFPNGQLPAYGIRTDDETICDIIVTDRFAYKLSRTLFEDNTTEKYFAERILALFKPLQKE